MERKRKASKEMKGKEGGFNEFYLTVHECKIEGI